MPIDFRSPSAARRAALRSAWPAAIELLERRRAGEIAEGDIEDYVAMNWLEWNGGGLRVTPTGDNVRRQVIDRIE